ncbi:MAG: DUF2207 domain-containing protein [Candidatus Levybacteria bacterium]|nr:DUF2207 domain-containing protein [Candidatus Levybacteria bacterium]
MKRILFPVLLLFIALLFPQHIFAQEGWVIDNFHSSIGIKQSGEVSVQENINVDFNTLEKHGIYRDIPYVYEDNGEKTYTEITITSVLQDNQKAKYDVNRDGNNIRIKIGDPDKTISGKHQYKVEYIVKGVLRGFTEYDELYWNVTGNGWEVNIQKASATVWLPQNTIKDIRCFQGVEGSNEQCESKKHNGTRADFATERQLLPGEGLTVVVSYEKNVIPILTVERPRTFFEKFIEPLSVTTLLVSLVFGLGTVLYIWYEYGRDYWFANVFSADKTKAGEVKPVGSHETVVVEFGPPEKLRPAEIGVLMDERAHTHDVTATIIDLATRGYLTITEIPKKWLFGKIDYELTEKQKDRTGLLDYETHLLNEFFKNRAKVKVSDLKLTFYDELAQVKKKLYVNVTEKKLFPTDPEKVRTKYLIIAVVVSIVGFVLLMTGGPSEQVFLFDLGVGILVSGLLFMILSQFMPRRSGYGREIFRRVRGYRLFLSGAEKYRQQFFEKRNLFNEVLPYVIVFGLTDKFAQAMKEIGLKPPTPTWYYGTSPFNVSSFGNNMSAFSSSIGSAIAATPNKGGGFSSGGSSGGGFGGGGGGSW